MKRVSFWGCGGLINITHVMNIWLFRYFSKHLLFYLTFPMISAWRICLRIRTSEMWSPDSGGERSESAGHEPLWGGEGHCRCLPRHLFWPTQSHRLNGPARKFLTPRIFMTKILNFMFNFLVLCLRDAWTEWQKQIQRINII